MPLDGYTLNYLVRSLAPLLIGGRVDKISQPHTYEIILQIRNRGENYRLRLDATPSNPRFMLAPEASAQPKQALHFCMFLRKALTSAKILEIKTLGLERLVLLRFSQLNELGDSVEKRLIFEIMGRHSNIIVLNHEKIILESLTHVDEKMSRVREILPTRPYQRPPKNHKLELNRVLVDLTDLAVWRAKKLTENPTTSLYDIMIGEWQGFSPFMARGCLAEIQAAKETLLQEVSLTDLEKIKNILHDFQQGKNQPALYQLQTNGKFDFHACTFPFHDAKYIPQTNIFSAMKEADLKNQHSQELQSNRLKIQQRCKQEQKQCKRKEALYLKDLKESENFTTYLSWGNLLTVHLHLSNTYLSSEQSLGLGRRQDKNDQNKEYFLRVARLDVNQTDVSNTTSTTEKETTLDIPLLPGKSVAQTAQIYFKTYTKLQEKYKQSTERLKEIKADINYIEDLFEASERIANKEDYLALCEELDLAFPAKKRSKKTKQQISSTQYHPGKPGARNKWKNLSKLQQSSKETRKSSSPANSILRLKLLSGHDVLVGRNNIQNEQLSLKIANKNDIWFHVKDGAGAHIILRNQGQRIDDFVISEIASICAWYNLKQSEREHLKLYQGQSVKQTIVYCPADHLFKAKGAKPGHILYENYKDITVFPREPELQPRDN